MRALLSELGGFTFCVAEFLRISQAVPGVRVFQRHVPELMRGGRTPTGFPVQVQLLGGDPGLLINLDRPGDPAGVGAGLSAADAAAAMGLVEEARADLADETNLNAKLVLERLFMSLWALYRSAEGATDGARGDALTR